MRGVDHLIALGLIGLSLRHAFGPAHQLKDAPRTLFYRAGTLTGLGLAAIVLLAWTTSGRSLQSFGLRAWVGDLSSLVAGGLVWAVVLLLYVTLAGREPLLGPMRRLYGRYEALMPTSRRELGQSWATAVAAGVGEEIAYRGLLLWYLTQTVGPGPGLLLCSLVFGLAHGYQRLWGMFFATLAGLVLGGVYLLGGSLLLVAWMHAAYNAASFTIGYRVLRRGQG